MNINILKNFTKAKKILQPMSDLREAQSKSSDNIVRNHVLWSMGAGAIIPPIFDSLGVAAIQLDMVRQMSKVYNVEFEDSKFKAIVSSILGTVLARSGVKSLIKLFPFAGPIVGGAAMGILSGASTFTLGELFKAHFETGGTMLDVDIDRMKRQFAEKFEKNKDVVRKIKEDHEKDRAEGNAEGGFSKPGTKESETDPNAGEPVTDEAEAVISVADELKKLSDLKKAKIITDAEFKKLKKNLIDSVL